MNDIPQKLQEITDAMAAANAVMEKAEAEIGNIDAVLARRTALDDQATRVDKIRKAIHVAARADELAKALEATLPYLSKFDPAQTVARDDAHTALNNYRRPFS